MLAFLRATSGPVQHPIYTTICLGVLFDDAFEHYTEASSDSAMVAVAFVDWMVIIASTTQAASDGMLVNGCASSNAVSHPRS